VTRDMLDMSLWFSQDVQLVNANIAKEMERCYPSPVAKKKSTTLLALLQEAELETRKSVSDLPLLEHVLRDPLLFGDYRNAINEEPRFYEDLLDYDAVYFLFQEILEEYNERKEKLNIVLFEDCLEHLTRAHRTLRMNRGHLLLVGVGGCGKQCITRLAAFAAGKTAENLHLSFFTSSFFAECEIFEISLTRGYNENSFKEDLKKLYTSLGVGNKQTVFMFRAAQVSD
jgi:dynein heavy chain, axonemal